MPSPLRALTLSAALALTLAAAAQSPIITRIDPPNWFATLPKPMLLVSGEHLTSASFTFSDPALTVERTIISANGHWAQLWLSHSPAVPETVQLRAHTESGDASVSYIFAPRRADGATGFSSADVLYLIMPDRFADGDRNNDNLPGFPKADRFDPHRYHGGDLKGVADHLDYLQQLGVTAVWLTPTLQNDSKASDYHGYGATDQYAVEPRLGTLADYQMLARELHRRGMKLVFDDVPNHVGGAHPWVLDPPTPDWFHGSAAQHLDNKYLFSPVSDPHAAPAATRDALDGWFANILADLNQDSPAVAQYLPQNMMWWIEEVGIDGLRIDTFPYVPRTFWQQYLGSLAAVYPHLTSIGEITTPDASLNAYFGGGRVLKGVDTHLTTPFDYPLWSTLIDVLTKGKPMTALEETLRQDWLYPHPEVLVPFLSNHDQKRFLSQTKLEGNSLSGGTPAALRLGFGLLMTLRGMPQLYAGEEILMEGGDDPDNRRDFPGGFPGDARNGFTAAGRTPAQNAMFDWLAALGKLRAASPALQAGAMQTVLATDSTFSYARIPSAEQPACEVAGSKLIVLNRSPSPQSLLLPLAQTTLAGCREAVLQLGDGSQKRVEATGGAFTVPLPANGFAVYNLERVP